MRTSTVATGLHWFYFLVIYYKNDDVIAGLVNRKLQGVHITIQGSESHWGEWKGFLVRQSSALIIDSCSKKTAYEASIHY